MNNGNAERNVSHSLAANGFLSHLDAAAIADDSFVSNSLVLATVAFPVFYRAENLLTKETVFFGFERSIINRFRFKYFTIRALQNRFWRSQANSYLGEVLLDLLCLSVRHI